MITDLLIYHTNDMHNRLPPDFTFPPGCDLLLDGGDAIKGSNTMFYFHEPVLCRMKELGYDAMALGNREFHYIRSIMKARKKETGFPILSANLLDMTGDDTISPFIIKEIKGLRIAIIGLTVQILPPGSFWEKVFNFKFLDPISVASEYGAKLKDKADLIFVLSHIGKDMDMRLAREVSGIDIIIGAHSHTPIEKPLKIGKTLIAQAGFHARTWGRLGLNIKKLEDEYIINSYDFELKPFN